MKTRLAPFLALLFLAPAAALAAPPLTFPNGTVIDDVKVHAPEVGYILSRKRNEDLELVQLRQPLLPEIFRSVDDSAFGPQRR